jgi:hypothetical protein
MRDDPFAVLGLPARAGLSDDDVRAAWRRIAAATHPDREDGGDPVRFGAAAAAYVMLRTSFGRGEALADLAAGHRAHGGLWPGRGRASRLRHGRPQPGRQRPSGLRPSGPRLSAPRHGEARHGERRDRVFSRGERQARRGAHRVETDGAGAGAGLAKGYRAVAWRLAGFLGWLTAGRGPGVRVAGTRVSGLAGPGVPGAGVRGLGLRVASAGLLAAATIAAVGVTPATIGLLAGALTVTGWALWRRGGWNR